MGVYGKLLNKHYTPPQVQTQPQEQQQIPGKQESGKVGSQEDRKTTSQENGKVGKWELRGANPNQIRLEICEPWLHFEIGAAARDKFNHG